jgi:aminoglycoside phosphotransferase (APT) family kinase protein
VPEPLGISGPLVMMARLSGRPMAARGDLPAEREQDVAKLLAGLHATDTRHLKTRDAAAIVRSVERKVAEMPQDRADWFEPVVDALARAAAAATLTPLVTAHGDFAPRNVLAGSSGLSLVDFDRVTLAPADRDLAYWGAWCWTTTLTIGRDPQWDAGDRLLRSYLDIAPDRGAGSAVGFHRAAALVRIAHGWSALQGEEAASHVRVIARESLRWALRTGNG